MCGTSRDGLDAACAEFEFASNRWTHRLIAGRTFRIPDALLGQIELAPQLATAQAQADVAFSEFAARCTNELMSTNPNLTEFVAMHGPTIGHQPRNGFSIQLGSGAVLAALTKLPTVVDFRQADISKGGQGAPLVPLVDELLFSEFHVCINLGGFANLSYRNPQRTGFDSGPCNLILNKLASLLGKPFDADGQTAAIGNIDHALLSRLRELDYYKQPAPKSLGTEWLEACFYPLFNLNIAPADLLATAAEHIAEHVSLAIPSGAKRCLVTGGGAHNSHLIRRIRAKTSCEIHLPSHEIIDYKEALAFAFLGGLRLLGHVNVLAAYTGASANSVAGAVYLP